MIAHNELSSQTSGSNRVEMPLEGVVSADTAVLAGDATELGVA